MINEPVTFDPAVKDIAQELSQLVARVRSRLSAHRSHRTEDRADYGTAA
jgi:hypothetical protein